MNRPRLLACAAFCGTLLLAAGARAAGDFAAELKPDRLVITDGGRPLAEYVFRDDKILRPYFTRLHAGGVQVTRNHPPVEGRDPADHDTMHPGLWLAFGDINGHDFWRNKAAIQHERFSRMPELREGRLAFTTENTLRIGGGQTAGAMTTQITLAHRPAGTLLIWEALFNATAGELVFGDQEEMGLGVRLATPLTEKKGGAIINSAGARGAKATWGKTADWCDYSGPLGKLYAGIMLMPDPGNFHPSWFHTRDYGLMAANPFGRNAFTKGEKSAVTVKPGESFRLRFGVLLHAAPAGQEPDLATEYQHFKDTLGGPP